MSFSADSRKPSIFFKLYSLPLIMLLASVISYGVIYAKVHQGWQDLPVSEKSIAYKVAVDVLNVRTEPTIHSPIQSKLYLSEDVQVSEIKEGWGKVDGGWVLLAYLQGS